MNTHLKLHEKRTKTKRDVKRMDNDEKPQKSNDKNDKMKIG